MQKKNLILLLIFIIFTFTYCSTDKDSFSEKPPITNKPISYPGENFTLLSKDHVPNSDLYGEGEILQNQSNNPKFMLATRKWQGIASIGKDRFGNLYSGWLTGGDGEGDDNYLTVSLSKDKGISWSHDKLVFAVNAQDSTRMKELSFFNDKFGNLYVVWGKHVHKKNSKEWATSWYSKLKLSSEGDTIRYSAPRKVAEGIMINKPFYSEIADELVFPIARWYEGGDPEVQQAFIYKANYGIDNLTEFRKVGSIPLEKSIRGVYEHMVVQLKDGTYLGMIRTLDGIYFSKSKDGNVWDFAQKLLILGDTTPARFHLARLKSGRLILIFNNSIKRSNMTICLSDDDGVTWSHKMVIDARGAVSYPDMIETQQGTLNIVYDYGRQGIGTINFVTIQEEDIVNNVTSNVFRTKISTLQ